MTGTMAHMLVFHNQERGWFTVNGVGWTDDEADIEHGKNMAYVAGRILAMILGSELTEEIYDTPVDEYNIVQYPDAAKHKVTVEYMPGHRQDLEVAFIRGPWYDQCPPEMRKPMKDHEENCTCFWCMNPDVTEISHADLNKRRSVRH